MTQLEAFALTILIEVAVAAALAKVVLPAALPLGSAARPPALAWVRLLGAVVLASCLTHPVLWAIAGTLDPNDWWRPIIAMELVIGVVEGVFVGVVGGAGLRRGLAIGVAMNAVSFGVGVLLTLL